MNPNDFPKICDQYLQHGKIFKNFQPATIRGYRTTFALFEKMTGIKSLQTLSPELIERFLYDGRIDRKWSVCTFRTYHKQLRAFCNWCVKKKLIPNNYTDNIDKPQLEKRLPKHLTPEQSETLLETAYHLKYHFKIENIRNRAIIGVMIFAGLRLSEIANLKRLDVDLTNEVITVRQGKWNKDRQIPIASRLMYFLVDYVEARGKAESRHVHFFSSVARDKPMGAHGIQVMCKKIKDRSGIAFSPQVLRHTFATLTYMGSRDIYAVSGLLGHAKVETTQIYAHLSLDDKRHSVERHVMNNQISP
jgi:site-specific recombinase XerD